jgi:hypothetical protein
MKNVGKSTKKDRLVVQQLVSLLDIEATGQERTTGYQPGEHSERATNVFWIDCSLPVYCLCQG